MGNKNQGKWGKVVATWAYTTAIQPMEEGELELEVWDKKIAEVILGWSEHHKRMRRGLLYLDTKKGGLGMVKLTEEEELVKLRLLSQIMQEGDRQRDRGQVPWAQKLLMEELEQPKEQTSRLIAGIKTQLEKLGVEISMKSVQTQEKTTEAWYQGRVAPTDMQDKEREQTVTIVW